MCNIGKEKGKAIMLRAKDDFFFCDAFFTANRAQGCNLRYARTWMIPKKSNDELLHVS